tara:strand:+ start:118 stop:375 length:258 start_codon:yes stop_codon:yes gene_type:complete
MKSTINIKGKFIPVDIEVSEETRSFMGEQVHLVAHSNSASGWQYLATAKAVRELAKSGDSQSVINQLEDSLSSDFDFGDEEGEEA